VLVDQSNRPAKAATVLQFIGETPFKNPGNQPQSTVPLTPGNNPIIVRSYDAGVCRPAEDSQNAGGCKYDVINKGDPNRKVLDPRVIIWQ